MVGLLGHNGAGKTSLMKAMVGLLPVQGELTVMGIRPGGPRGAAHAAELHPGRGGVAALGAVAELIELMARLQPQFSAERARAAAPHERCS